MKNTVQYKNYHKTMYRIERKTIKHDFIFRNGKGVI